PFPAKCDYFTCLSFGGHSRPEWPLFGPKKGQNPGFAVTDSGNNILGKVAGCDGLGRDTAGSATASWQDASFAIRLPGAASPLWRR
ncbi:MAG: hypothetical protein ABSE82_13110, partial [Nitrososphaerales archaeon]